MSSYSVGSTLEVHLLRDDANNNANFQILHPYLPFTLAVVLKARLLHDLDGLTVGSTVILKLYDRRFVLREDTNRKGHSWTERSEHLARERWAATTNQIDNDSDALDPQTDPQEEASSEEYWHTKTKTSFFTEVEAYKRLHAYQGINIPTFHHSFRLVKDPTPGQTIPLDTAHMPHGIMIQYLEGAVTAGEYVPDPETWPNLRKSTRDIMSFVSMLPSHGIIHDDIRLANILVGQESGMVIDFGSARFRGANASDEDWEEEYEGHDDIGAARWILHRRGLRAESPIPPYPEENKHIGSQNYFIHNHTSSWIDRWYDTLLEADKKDAIIKDPSLCETTICYRKKEEVEKWQATRRLDYEGFQQPRPGSPDWQRPTI